MRTFFAVFVFLVTFPVVTHAWSGLGDAGAGMTVDYNPGVSLTATPQTITAGESTYVTLAAPLAIDNVTSSPEPDVAGNCTTNFSYTAVPAPSYVGGTINPVTGEPLSNYWGTMGTVTDYPTATKTYTATCRLFVSEGASGVTYRYETATVTVTVNPAAAIDLTAASITPTNATGGEATLLSSVISNVGTNATSAGFTNLFQIATDANGSGAQDIGTYVRSEILSGSVNFTATYSYTFPVVTSTQTQYVRACADKSSRGNTGAITESNEDNNCSPWTAVTVSPQCNDSRDNDNDGLVDLNDVGCSNGGDNNESNDPTVSSVSCDVMPSTVAVGGSATYTAYPSNGATSPYTWTPTGGQSCTYSTRTTSSQWRNDGVEIVNYECGAVNPQYALDTPFCSNNQTPTGSCTAGNTCKTSTNAMYPAPASCVQYSMYDELNMFTCQGATTVGNAVCTFPVQGPYGMTVTATGSGNPSDTCTFVEVGADPVAYIEADRDRVNVGDSVNLTWSAANVTSCIVTGTEGYVSGTLTGPTVATSTPVTRDINTQTSFTISCDGGAATHTVIVNIAVNADEF